jgi:hypothetical protein
MRHGCQRMRNETYWKVGNYLVIWWLHGLFDFELWEVIENHGKLWEKLIYVIFFPGRKGRAGRRGIGMLAENFVFLDRCVWVKRFLFF